MVVFTTDVFHPLVTPLTTYTYTTSSSEAETVSASDEQRLPPGGFSLHHGFPQWYQQQSGIPILESNEKFTNQKEASRHNGDNLDVSKNSKANREIHPETAHETSSVLQMQQSQSQHDIPMPMVLEYLRVTFSDESVLDSLPIKAAGNPGVSVRLSRQLRLHVYSISIGLACMEILSKRKLIFIYHETWKLLFRVGKH